jgi:muconate cycloisomerase
LPFSGFFSHSIRRIASAKNVVVEVIADQGKIKGYGEGAPRTYVTGESQNEAAKSICDFVQHENFPWNLTDISQVWKFIDSLSEGKDHNAAICAIETALLDAFGRSREKNIIEYFPKDFYTEKINYGAGIPLDSKYRVMEICQLIKDEMKINKLKLKVGKDLTQNKEALETIQAVFGNDYDLKVDVNGVWDRELAFQHLPLLKKFKIKVIEQPMIPHEPNIKKFAELVKTAGMILMADESACSLGDVGRIFQEGAYKMINIRLSKCGGFRRTFRIIDYLREKGITFQIGCHLGESGILSAAGRILSLLCRDAVYYDGSYDEFLLKENLTRENVTFGLQGVAGPITGPGLGAPINPQQLIRLSNDEMSITELGNAVNAEGRSRHGF